MHGTAHPLVVLFLPLIVALIFVAQILGILPDPH